VNRGGSRWTIAILVVWTLVLLTLLTMPVSEIPMPHAGIFRYMDKYIHVVLFAVTGFVSIFGVRFRRFGSRVFFGLFFSLFLAFGTEFVQSFIRYRTADFYDLMADLLGVFAGLFVYMLCYLNEALRSYLRL
jgi:VanZ family protein